jgi:hypothetical protein
VSGTSKTTPKAGDTFGSWVRGRQFENRRKLEMTSNGAKNNPITRDLLDFDDPMDVPRAERLEMSAGLHGFIAKQLEGIEYRKIIVDLIVRVEQLEMRQTSLKRAFNRIRQAATSICIGANIDAVHPLAER